MRNFVKSLLGYASPRSQQSIKRMYYARQIRRGKFQSGEPEFHSLNELISEGDWVIDVGANIGYYTLAMSSLVKASGRVLAFEPIPNTFELLASNCLMAPYRNISLFNAAVSDTTGIVNMDIPAWDGFGKLNYFEAHISTENTPAKRPSAKRVTADSWSIFSINIDSLELPQRIGFIKIDAEGHEPQVVQGMMKLILRDKPVLMVESRRAGEILEPLGFTVTHRPDSSNYIWRYQGK